MDKTGTGTHPVGRDIMKRLSGARPSYGKCSHATKNLPEDEFVRYYEAGGALGVRGACAPGRPVHGFELEIE